MKAVHSPQVSVFDRIDTARSARSDLIASGHRPHDVRILDARAAAVTRHLDGPPIPEAIAGLIVGGLLTTTLAVVPQIASIFDRGGLPMYALVAVGAIASAAASFFLARAHPPVIIDRDLTDGEYVVIAYDAPVEQRAA